MAENKKTEAAAAAAPPEAACLTLRQKLVEMRKACPEIVKKQHSDGVSYKYAKIYDVWEKITPIMNELGVDFDVISEQATRHAENGDPVYWITMQTKTRNGDKLMFFYEADLTIRWLNLDNDDETIEATVHAVGWNDDPAKAKGAAHTYALKYYLFEKFTVDQGEDDPDNSDFGAQGKGSGAGGRPLDRGPAPGFQALPGLRRGRPCRWAAVLLLRGLRPDRPAAAKAGLYAEKAEGMCGKLGPGKPADYKVFRGCFGGGPYLSMACPCFAEMLSTS